MSKFKKQFIFIIIGVAILVAGGVAIWAVNNKGDAPFIYLKMEEGTGATTNDSMNNVDASLQGGATWAEEDSCVSGKCVNLDGTGDYISLPDFSLE